MAPSLPTQATPPLVVWSTQWPLPTQATPPTPCEGFRASPGRRSLEALDLGRRGPEAGLRCGREGRKAWEEGRKAMFAVPSEGGARVVRLHEDVRLLASCRVVSPQQEGAKHVWGGRGGEGA